MREIKLDEISFKEGTSKNNRPYTMVFITSDGKSYSMYCDNERNKRKIDTAKTWKPGTKVTLKFETNGEYENFDIPSKVDTLEVRIERLEQTVVKLAKIIKKWQAEKDK